jgi:hypothetical protein
MSLTNKQENISQSGAGNKVIGGDDKSTNTIYLSSTKGKLASLFEKLKDKFENEDSITQISENLKKYTDRRDTLGLEEKLKDADKTHLYEDFAWCKQEFYKKLVRYQNYEPAQEIFAFILAIVLERYRNIIKPMIRDGASETDILAKISNEITNPIVTLIQQEGCNDIMGLSATEIDGMFHYLTGNCHIKWKL